jgi:hypothetical protein
MSSPSLPDTDPSASTILLLLLLPQWPIHDIARLHQFVQPDSHLLYHPLVATKQRLCRLPSESTLVMHLNQPQQPRHLLSIRPRHPREREHSPLLLYKTSLEKAVNCQSLALYRCRRTHHQRL